MSIARNRYNIKEGATSLNIHSMFLGYYSNLPVGVAAVQTDSTLTVRITELRNPTPLQPFSERTSEVIKQLY